jgi:HEAT repeat protein
MSPISSSLFQEIQDQRRRGATTLEFWDFLIHSPRHCLVWEAQSPEGKLASEMWRFLLKEGQRKYIQKWDEKHPGRDPASSHWWPILQKTPSRVRAEAIAFLGRKGKRAKQALPFVIKALTDTSREVRIKAVWAVGEIDVENPLAISALLKVLKEEQEEELYEEATEALGKIGPDSKEAFPLLLQSLYDSSEEVRYQSLLALDALEQESPELVTALLHVLKQDSLRIIREAVWILMKVKNTSSLPALAFLFQEIKSSEKERRKLLKRTLIRLVFNLKELAVTPLLELLEKDTSQAPAILTLLEKLGPWAKTALPVLKQRQSQAEAVALQPFLNQAIQAIEKTI